MNDRLCWLMLQQCFGFGTTACGRMLEKYGHPREIFGRNPVERSRLPGLSEKEAAELKGADPAKVEKLLDFCEDYGCGLITPDDEEYPDRLRNIYSPPAVLYVLGDMGGIGDALAIAIVGTRNCTSYGKRAADEISGQLAASGVTVVSGMAVGIDTAAHKGALRAGGRTVAVMGTGIDLPYPRSNDTLARQITDNGGAVITEFPPGSQPLPFHFPLRNRIISGLCQGTLVVEGGRHSGSLITAGHALTQGRDVFAVPGDIYSACSAGTNWLISEGAKLTCSAEDILSEYSYMLDDGEEKDRKIFKNRFDNEDGNGYNERKTSGGWEAADGPAQADLFALSALGEEQLRVYEVIGAAPVSSDKLAALTGLGVGKVLSALTQLEIFGLVRVHPGRLFSR